MHNPLAQFALKKLIEIEFLGLDISFTNATLFMVLASLLIVWLIYFAVVNFQLTKPGRIQALVEMLYEIIVQMLRDNIGENPRQHKFVGLVFSVFLFVLFGNLLGMLPYGFTFTSHIVVTFTLALVLFLLFTFVALLYHGWHFFHFFLPKGTPIILAPLMIVIEVFTYLARPITLSMRLAANMVAGHILLKVLASFVLMLGWFGWLPLPFMILFTAFEIFVAILQAYIFSILVCSYLGDAINLH